MCINIKLFTPRQQVVCRVLEADLIRRLHQETIELWLNAEERLQFTSCNAGARRRGLHEPDAMDNSHSHGRMSQTGRQARGEHGDVEIIPSTVPTVDYRIHVFGARRTTTVMKRANIWLQQDVA